MIIFHGYIVIFLIDKFIKTPIHTNIQYIAVYLTIVESLIEDILDIYN